MSEETITIKLSTYNRLSETEDFMLCLESAGVDNWEGYYLACNYMRTAYPYF
jgi:hypothetical protein